MSACRLNSPSIPAESGGPPRAGERASSLFGRNEAWSPARWHAARRIPSSLDKMPSIRTYGPRRPSRAAASPASCRLQVGRSNLAECRSKVPHVTGTGIGQRRVLENEWRCCQSYANASLAGRLQTLNKAHDLALGDDKGGWRPGSAFDSRGTGLGPFPPNARRDHHARGPGLPDLATSCCFVTLPAALRGNSARISTPRGTL